MKKDIFGLSLAELQEQFTEQGMRKYRADQVFDWLYKKNIDDFSRMPNISKQDAAFLQEHYTLLPQEVAVKRAQTSADELTKKLLVAFPDEELVETVLMQHDYGNTFCVSSQVGCAMGCVFCASGLEGVKRNLTAAEIILQVYLFAYLYKLEGKKAAHLVLMGSGEPFLNFDAVLEALDFLHQNDTLFMSYRNMTISTCGIVPGIKKLAERGVPINLAVSLHAPNDELRSRLMPINLHYPLREVVGAAQDYAARSGRQITYEYILLKGQNDSPRQAEELVRLLRGKNASVNLIPANPVPEKGVERPEASVTEHFRSILNKARLPVTLRREMGKDIDAACGQLRAGYKANR